MGFYLRKSISVGPFRFNLSGSGIGVSAGVKGLRFGVGPRGNYVHVGLGGLYYRTTIPSPRMRPSPRNAPPRSADPIVPSGTHAPLQEIESADVSEIVDSSSKELLAELNERQQKIRLWPIVLTVMALGLVVGLAKSWPEWLVFIWALATAASAYAAYQYDALRKTVVLFYELEGDAERGYEALHDAGDKLARCSAAWHIEAQGRVHDRKYHAGASSVVRRKPTFIRKSEPPYVKTNIETICIAVGRQTLHFFPDRVLIYAANGVGAVSYGDLRLTQEARQFVEDSQPPRDARVVGQTWQYVNKSGAPDRRFKNNRQLPICLYDEITLTSVSGLNEVLQVSQSGVAQFLVQAASDLSKLLPQERPSLSAPTA